MDRSVLIFGGAGFLGSHLVRSFAGAGWRVTAIDGLMPGTGGKESNVSDVRGVELIFRPLAEISDLSIMLSRASLAVDAMAWTAHLLALEDPRYDLQLNADSHLILLQALRKSTLRRVVYLGSRGQYGNTAINPLTEESPMEPNDIQGIHKLAAESYFRVFAVREKFDVLSLRLPNCFGERQPTSGRDLGLVGSFMRNALADRQIEVFGHARGRSLLYADDFADIVLRAVERGSWRGFTAVNIPGYYATIAHLAQTIISKAGRGAIALKELPSEIKDIDPGSVQMDSGRLDELVGAVSYTPLEVAIEKTVSWVRENSL